MPNTIVNHFNISTIKKRIIMMNAKKSSGYKLARYLFLVPAVVALLLVFSLSKAEISKKGMHTIKSLATAITSVAIVDNNKPNTTIHIKAAKPILAKKVKATADTVYAGKSKNGKKSILLTSNKSMDSIGYVINGIRSSRADLSAIDPAHIYSVDMISAKHAKEFINDVADKSDFVFVTTDDSEAGKKIKEKIDKSFRSGTIAKAYNLTFDSKDSTSDIAPAATGSGSSSTTMNYSISKSSDEAPVAIGEGSGSNNISAVVITGVDPKVKAKTMAYTKKNIAITKDPKVAITISGSGDNGAPLVYTEDISEARPPGDKVKTIYFNKLRNNDELTIDGQGEPLLIIDGKQAKSLKNLAPSDIKSLTVLKDGTAEKKYGEKGKNGVIEITTKKGK
jgi:TonB-dependent SusC/RagA subfamily outer membrane receptor